MTTATITERRAAAVKLLAFRRLLDAGWATAYLGPHRQGLYEVVDLPDVRRAVRYDRAFWWAQGLADGGGQGHAVQELIGGGQLPQVLTTEEIAAQLGLAEVTVKSMFGKGRLAPVYIPYHGGPPLLGAWQREVDAEQAIRREDSKMTATEKRKALINWKTFRTDVIPLPTGEDIGAAGQGALFGDCPNKTDFTLTPKRHQARCGRCGGWAGHVGQGEIAAHEDLKPEIPLAIPHGRPNERAATALDIAEREGWASLVHSNHEASRYDLDVSTSGGGITPREVPQDKILPYIHGLGDAHGLGHLASYQAGQQK